MNWLFPGFLAAGLFAGLPILLHLLRKRPVERIRFPSLRFVSPSALQTRRPQQIMRWIVLALRCAIIAGIAAAFARPFWNQPVDPSSRAIVVAVDNSFSMQAGGRWETLKAWAEGQLGVFQPGDRVGILLMNPSPRWLVPMSEDAEAAKRALHALEPGFETTRYRAALALASETLAQTPAAYRTLIWMGDEQRAGWQDVDFTQPLAPGVRLRIPPAQPAPPRQAAITGVVCHSASVEIRIRQFTPAHDKRTLSVFANGKLVEKRTVELDAGKPLALPLAVTQGTEWMQFSLDADDCPADDTAYAVTNPDAALGVLLPETAAPDFLKQAIEASQQAGLQALRITAPPTDAPWPLDCVAVLRGEETFRPPLLDRVNAFVKAGGAAWVIVDGSPAQRDWLKARGITETPSQGKRRLCGLDIDHPVFAAFANSSLLPLLDPEIAGGFSLSGESLIPVALWTDQSTAMAENGHLLITGFDFIRAASPIPLSPAFVPLVHQTILFLGRSGEAPAEALRVGHPASLPNQPGTWTALATPRPESPAEVNGSTVPSQPGVYRYRPHAGGPARLYAVNLPEEESDLAPWPDDRWKTLENPQTAPATQGHRITIADRTVAQKSNLWWWLILAAAGLLLLETNLANRTAL